MKLKKLIEYGLDYLDYSLGNLDYSILFVFQKDNNLLYRTFSSQNFETLTAEQKDIIFDILYQKDIEFILNVINKKFQDLVMFCIITKEKNKGVFKFSTVSGMIPGEDPGLSYYSDTNIFLENSGLELCS
jgi:hypothetical protein